MIEKQTIETSTIGVKGVPLGDLVSKKTLKATAREYPEAKFIGMDCIEPHSLRPSFLYDFKDFKSSGNYFTKDQVLYGRMRPYLNKVYRAEFDGVCSGEFIVMECKSNIIPDFLKYILHSRAFVRFANTKTSGDRPRISFDEIADYVIRIPSVSEQQQIVTKIEELFSELDKGIELLKTAHQQLKTYRQAVLKCAFEGKLTNENVKVGELPKGWKKEKLKNVCIKIQDGSHFSPQVQYDDPGENRYKYITAKNIRNNYMDFTKVTYVDKEFHKSIYSRCNPEFGDVLLTKDGVNTGEVTLNSLKEEFSLLSSVCLFKTNNNFLYPLFLKYFIQSPIGSKSIIGEMSGTAIKRIVLKKIKDSEIFIPTIKEQENVIQEIESRLSVADKMQESINKNIQQAEALRQSILKKAFEGKLVASDTIETIKESAKVIPLERKVLAGKIIHLLHDDKYFGLTKFQKTLYLVENYAEVHYETSFLQDRAGPHDKEFTIAFRKEMQEKDWLQEEQRGKITKFMLGDNIGSLIKDYALYFREKGKQIVFVIQQLKDKSTHEAELIATLYAVWNNRLIKKKPVKIDLLIEDFFSWSAKKKEEFQPEEVMATFKWMKQIKFVPSGFGEVIGTN